MREGEDMSEPDYICEDCEIAVFNIGPPPDDRPLCQACRFIRANPHLSESFKAALRGDSTETNDA